MHQFEETTCRLCLNIIVDKDFEVIEDIGRALLNTLSMKLTLDEKDIICRVCSKKLLAAYDFKSRCTDMEDNILSYSNTENGALVDFIDLRDVYLKTKGKEQPIKIEKDQKICRLCMQLVNDGFRQLEEIVHMIDKYIPEVNWNSTKDPVICQKCFHSLEVHTNFLKECCDIEERIKNPPMDKYPNEGVIEVEKIEIKSEGDQERARLRVMVKTELKNCDHDNITTAQQNESEETSNHDIAVRMYKCDECIYQTKRKDCLTRHQRKHRYASEIKMYKCDECEFQAKWRNGLISHQLKHRDPSEVTQEVQIFKCDKCDFQTIHKCSLVKHQIRDRHAVEVQIYKCDKCAFQTMRKGIFRNHQLRHKDPSEIKTYTCDLCDFHTNWKGSLTSHRLQHRDSSEVQIYTCNMCEFQTKWKSNLVSHQLKHKDPSEVKMYKCDECDYQTKLKSNLIRHQNHHKDCSKVQEYTCDFCDFHTNQRGSLVSHRLQHGDAMYKCDKCEFQTKWKGNLASHQLKHKDFSEVKMHKCDKCNYQTNLKSNLIRHQKCHKDT